MKYWIILFFTLTYPKVSFAQEAKARDMVVDSALVWIDSTITIPKAKDVVILKPKYLTKLEEKPLNIQETPQITPKTSTKITKYLKTKAIKKNLDLTDGEKLAIVGGIFLGIGLSLLTAHSIKTTKIPNIALIVGIPSAILGYLSYKEFESMSNFIFIGWFFSLLSFISLCLTIGSVFWVLVGVFGHLKLLLLWTSGGLITFGLIFLGIGCVLLIWAHLISR